MERTNPGQGKTQVHTGKVGPGSDHGQVSARGYIPDDTVLLSVASTDSWTAACHEYAAFFVTYTAPCRARRQQA